jgi:uncharacterized protein (TIGR02391 family)
MTTDNRDEAKQYWGIRTIVDPYLEKIVAEGSLEYNFSDRIRQAFVLLEQRIREKTGLAEHDFGKDLIDKAFHPDKGLLQPVSPVSAERAGLHNLLIGVFLYYRNPIAHRPIQYDAQSAWQIFHLINHALRLVEESAQAAFDIRNYVGAHEGQIGRRRDFHLDIDGDGELEIIALVELGPRSENGTLVPHLLPVILKKNGSGYLRILSEGIVGVSIHGPHDVELRQITTAAQPDIVVSWLWGENQVFTFVLRKTNDGYAIVKRDIAGLTEPYSGPSEQGFVRHFRQELRFADVDGDDLVELIQGLRFDDKDISALGYKTSGSSAGTADVICRVLKWDNQEERIVKIKEHLVHYSRLGS